MQVRTTLVIDGQTLLDHELGEWQNRPPESLAHLIKPGAQASPVLKTAMIALADALMANQPIHVEATTYPDGYDLKVRRP